MGDRANIVIEQGDGTRVWLYGRWMGHYAPEILQAALRRGKDQWNHTPNLARIVFCEMINRNVAELTGFGITTRMANNERPVLVLDAGKSTVVIEDDPCHPQAQYYPCINQSYSFEKWCALEDIGWDTLNYVFSRTALAREAL